MSTIMKLRNLLAIAIIAILGAVFATTALTQGAEPSATEPVFNAFEDTDRYGDERDFVRVRNSGTDEAYRNSVTDACTDGQHVSIQVYIHNSSIQDYNGEDLDGPVVAQNTKLSLTKDGDDEVKGVITADNAATVVDKASITCNGDPVEFDFIADSAVQSNANGVTRLPNALFTEDGTRIGFAGADGVLPACWEYITMVYAKVEVKIPEVVEMPAVCKAIDAVLNERALTIRNVVYEERDATVNSIEINYGDGRVETVQPGDAYPAHTYEPGTYTLKATLNTTFQGETSRVSSKACEFPIDIEKEVVNPHYACEMFTLTRNDRKVNVSFLPVARDGATFKDATIRYTLDGEEKNVTVTNNTDADGKVNDMYEFAEDGQVRVVATVAFNVEKDGKVVVETVKCKGQTVLSSTIEKCPIPGKEHLPVDSDECVVTELPKTGAGSTAGILVAVAAVGAYAHRALTLKRQ